jgi:hypothetical protein
VAKTTTHISAILGDVRQLPGGKLLVNDYGSRRLMMFDSMLVAYTVLRDSSEGQVNSYGSRVSVIIPHLADSSLFVDVPSQSLLVIDPEGRFTRVMALPVLETVFAPLGEMLDYYPPIRERSVRADRDNNIWILPTTTAYSNSGELVYDVVNRAGKLFERVRIPEGRSITGFGPGGVVYLMSRDASRGWVIEKTRVQR